MAAALDQGRSAANPQIAGQQAQGQGASIPERGQQGPIKLPERFTHQADQQTGDLIAESQAIGSQGIGRCGLDHQPQRQAAGQLGNFTGRVQGIGRADYPRPVRFGLSKRGVTFSDLVRVI